MEDEEIMKEWLELFEKYKPQYKEGKWIFYYDFITCKRCHQSDDLANGLCFSCYKSLKLDSNKKINHKH